jgi:hypothetical protein
MSRNACLTTFGEKKREKEGFLSLKMAQKLETDWEMRRNCRPQQGS